MGKKPSRPKTHGWEYRKAKQEYLRSLASKNPPHPVSKHVRGWIKNELRRIARRKRLGLTTRLNIRVPRGYNVGHKVPGVMGGANHPSNLELERARMNYKKGPRERLLARKKLIGRLIEAIRKLRGR